MTSRKHTHVGHCQACARTHAVGINSGNVAKHGYTTRFGFFMGTCGGSDEKPLEVSRSYADDLLVRLAEYAASETRRAAALLSGEATLVEVRSGKHKVDSEGRSVRDRAGNKVPVMIPWDEATPEQRTRAVDVASRLAQQNAAGASAHAKQLAALIPTIHGKPLTSVVPVDPVADAPLAVGDIVRVFGKSGFDAECIAIRGAVCHGCGPYLNGKYMDHAIFRRPSGGEVALPLRNIRRTSIVKRAAAKA